MVRSVIGMCAASVMIMSVPAFAQTAATPAAATPAPVAPAEKVRCKRYVETGSLAKTRKECHTEAEWTRMAENNRQNAREMINSSLAPGSSPN